MIKFEFSKNKGNITAFCVTGHSGFAAEGSDIVCSAVSALTINTANAIERFCDARFTVKADEQNGGYLSFELDEAYWKDACVGLLLKTLELGVTDIEKNYSDYINIFYKEAK